MRAVGKIAFLAAFFLWQVFLIAGALEFLAGRWNKHHAPVSLRGCTGPIAAPHPLIGAFTPPNLKGVSCSEVKGGRLVYSMRVSSDALGRRITVLPNDRPRPAAAIFFGDSFTFGTGVNDSETLPSAFARQQRQLRPYNYAMRARGADEMLAWLESGQLAGQVHEPVKLGIYVFMSDHYYRAIGAMRSAYDFPYHPLVGGEPAPARFFNEEYPLLTAWYGFWEESETLKLIGADRLSARLNETNKQHFCALIRKSRDLFVRQFPSARFVVLDYRVLDTGHEESAALRECVEGLSIPLLEFDMRGIPGYKIPDNDHPTALAHDEAASSLVQWLGSGGF